MPFGLSSSPASVLNGDLNMTHFFRQPYNLSNGFEQHLEKLDMVLTRLSEYTLKGSLTPAVGKCLWFSVKLKVYQLRFYAQLSFPFFLSNALSCNILGFN